MIIEHLAYDPVEDKFNLDIFTAGQTKQDFSKAGEKLKRHIYDYVITDSGIERKFVETLDTCTEGVVYAKLPRGFLILTPVGDYNSDWAISFKEGTVKHFYFRCRDQGVDVNDATDEDRRDQDRKRPQVFRRKSTGSMPPRTSNTTWLILMAD